MEIDQQINIIEESILEEFYIIKDILSDTVCTGDIGCGANIWC